MSRDGRPTTKRGGGAFETSVPLEEAELEFRLLVENVHDVAIFLMDTEGIITSWNAAAQKMKGFTPDEAIGSHFRLLYLPEDAEQRKPEQHMVIARERGKFQEKGYRTRKDSPPFWAQVLLTPLWDEDGNLRGFAKITQDRTNEKVIEDRLKQQVRIATVGMELAGILGRRHDTRETLQQLTEVLVSHLDLAVARVWTIHPTREMLEVQAGAGLFHGQEGPDAQVRIGERWIGRLATELHPCLSNDISDQVWNEHREWAEAKGLVALAGFPLVVDERQVGVLVLFSRQPLSEEFQAGLAMIAEGLAQYLERRKVEDQLRDRVQELADTNRRKDEFLAMLAHELRNPLAPIRNAMHLLRHHAGEDTRLQRVQGVIDRQVEQMARLLDDLLEVSRVTRGRFELRKEALDLRQVMHNAVQTSRPVIDGREHELIVSVPPHPVRVTADPSRLEQVLVNLLNNAAKYTDPRGEIQVHLEIAEPGTRAGSGSGSEAVIRVQDSGIGIDGETLPHIFDLFVQADRPLDRGQGGLGIGLTIVHRVIEMHGGSVAAHSDGIGQGSEFVIRLPLDPSAEVGGPVLTPAEQARLAGRPLQVLVVDDNTDAADTLADLIPLWGYEVRVAYDATTALELMAEYRPDVLLLDIGLPRMDGYELAHRLREEQGLTNACYVAVTGYGRQEEQQRALEAGFQRHLTKPIDPEVLRSILDRVAAP